MTLRALFDHVAQYLNGVAPKPGVSPSSFHDLQTWLGKKPGNPAQLGQGVAEVIASCDWFDRVQRGQRRTDPQKCPDEYDPNRNLFVFRILQPRSIEKLAIPAVMFNDAVVDFVRTVSAPLQDGMDAQRDSGSSAQSSG